MLVGRCIGILVNLYKHNLVYWYICSLVSFHVCMCGVFVCCFFDVGVLVYGYKCISISV